MANYRSSLTGSQMDDALSQMNNRVPEGWAVGERDGVPVGEESLYYHNNAKYYAEQAQAQAESAEESAESASQVAQETADAVIAQAFVQESAEVGSIVTIDDGADNIPLKDLKVNLAINQPLHGQANPYPAGGGKNLLVSTIDTIKSANRTGTWSGNTYTLNDISWAFEVANDGAILSITVNGTASDNSRIDVGTMAFTADTSYVLSGCPSDGSPTTYQLASSTTGVVGYDRGNGATINATATTTASAIRAYVYSGVTVTNQKWYPMIRLASISDGTFAPYSNICPIYPITAAEVSRTGKNLLNPADFHLDKNYDGASFTGRAVFVQKMRNETVTISASNGTGFSEITVGRSAIPYPFPNLTSADLKDAATITNNGTKTLTFEDTHPYLYVFLRKSTTISDNDIISAQLQLERGSTTTTYTPYAGQQHLLNIGIQQWDEDWEVGTINNDTGAPETDANNIRSKNFCPCIAGTSYNIVSKDSKVLRYYFYDKDETFISGGATSGTNTIVTAPTGACYFKVRTTSSYGSTYLNDISVNFPSRFTDYHAYTGNVVYGGELDVTTGVLPARYASVDLGSLTYDRQESSTAGIYFFNMASALPDAKVINNSTPINGNCDIYKMVAAATLYYGTADNGSLGVTDGKGIRIRNDAYTDPATFKTAMAGHKLVYELATPISIQLTPTEVDTLRGDNVIWADCGDIKNCEYRADLKMYIDKVVGA